MKNTSWMITGKDYVPYENEEEMASPIAVGRDEDLDEPERTLKTKTKLRDDSSPDRNLSNQPRNPTK